MAVNFALTTLGKADQLYDVACGRDDPFSTQLWPTEWNGRNGGDLGGFATSQGDGSVEVDYSLAIPTSSGR